MPKETKTCVKAVVLEEDGQFTVHAIHWPIVAWGRDVPEAKLKFTEMVIAYVHCSFIHDEVPFYKAKKSRWKDLDYLFPA